MSGTLFYATALTEFDVRQLSYSAAFTALVDELDTTRVDLADGVAQDWELGVPFLPGMDEVRVDTARLALRGLRVPVPAEGWTAVAKEQGWRITLARPARLAAIAFDPPQPDAPQPGKDLRLMLSPASPPGPPSFVDPPFPLGAAYQHIPRPVSQSAANGRTVASFPPTFGSSWLLQWGYGDNATELAPAAVKTTIRAVTVELAVSDVRLELRAAEPGGEPVLLWNHPGVLDPANGAQPVDLAPMARKRLTDRLAAANTAAGAPPTLTLPLRLVAESGGPVGVSGTELRVDYAAAALDGPPGLALRGQPQPLALSVPAALRPATATVSLTARHLGRELNGPVGPAAPDGGPGRLVTVDRWAAVALPVVAVGADPAVTLAAVTLDVAADAAAELAVDVRADVHGLPGAVLASAVTRLQPGDRAVRELLFDPVPTTAPGAVVWVTARTTTGTVRWYDDPADAAVALPDLTGPTVRVSADGGLTWAPDEGRLGPSSIPRARLLHRVVPPYAAPTLELSEGRTGLGELRLATGGAPDEFVLAAAPLPAAVADLAGRSTGTRRATLTVHIATSAALDLRVTGIDLVYPPTAGPTGR